MDENQRKEQFSNAYVRAVASVAGYALSKPDVDEDSVDWTISARGGGGTIRSPKLDIQLKCSGRNIRSDTEIRFPLSVKNYNELRMPDYMAPRVLVVVVVPSDIRKCLHHSEEQLAMRHCGYWASLRGQTETANEESVTIRIPRTQQFTVDALTAMMLRIGSGGLP